MAENTQWKHSVCVSLTYDDAAPGGYEAARFFAYHDVRAFVQRITSALRRIDRNLCVRFICAGEQGSRNGRCHWHLILWSNFDLRMLGEVTYQQATYPIRGLRKGMRLTQPGDMMTEGKNKRRLHWSLWARDGVPLGFVTFGKADVDGAHYVVSYCLKDQFTFEKSEGTGREAKSEDFATGLFRMSKRPAIGEAWLMQKLAALAEKRAVLSNTHLLVPGLPPGRYWYPSGTLRKKLLTGLRAINDQRRQDGLGDAPQWPGLLASCQDNPSDLEILLDVKEIEQDDYEEPGLAIERKARWRAGEETRAKQARFRRDFAAICDPCLEGEGRRVRALRDATAGGWFFQTADGADAFGKAFILENFGAVPCCEACGQAREVWAVRREAS
jgi:hypothetical protein